MPDVRESAGGILGEYREMPVERDARLCISEIMSIIKLHKNKVRLSGKRRRDAWHGAEVRDQVYLHLVNGRV
jgi:hypothetical protein